ncbi:MAG: hypothetical protein AB7N76_13570 [Planctomycetota bacterium]
MSDLRKYGDKVWDRFFDQLLTPVTSTTPMEEVDAELALMEIDVAPAVSKVRKAVESARARARLASAKAERPRALDRLRQLVTAAPDALRDSLHAMIEQRFAGTAQAAYFRKLEGAASEEDLRSLLEDLERLEAFSGEDDEAPRQ